MAGSLFITEITDYQQCNLESEVLQRNYSILYQAISADDIVPSLFATKLITSAEMDEINSCTSGGAKNTVLLTALRRRTRPLHQFCEILSTTPGQEDLAKLLLRGKSLFYYLVCILYVADYKFESLALCIIQAQLYTSYAVYENIKAP